MDDLLLFGPDEKEMNKVLKELELDGFELKTEKEAKDVSCDFLGTTVTQTEDEKDPKTIKLTQLSLIRNFLECVKMVNCNASGSPSLVQPFGTDANGVKHHEPWDCASAVGMLMHLAGNAHPKIQCAVHQCARFTHAPRHSHAEAVKRIARHLKGVLQAEQGMSPTRGVSSGSCYSRSIEIDMYSREELHAEIFLLES